MPNACMDFQYTSIWWTLFTITAFSPLPVSSSQNQTAVPCLDSPRAHSCPEDRGWRSKMCLPHPTSQTCTQWLLASRPWQPAAAEREREEGEVMEARLSKCRREGGRQGRKRGKEKHTTWLLQQKVTHFLLFTYYCSRAWNTVLERTIHNFWPLWLLDGSKVVC